MSGLPVRVAVIGYGYAGSRIHVPLIRLAPQLQLWGVCSGDPAKRDQISRELGCHIYGSFEQTLVDKDVQLVVLATPNWMHAPQALAAMRAGKHVLIDKPMCLTSEKAQELIDCSRSAGKALSVFHNRRWDGDYLTLRHLLETGELGDLRWLEMSWQRASLPRTWKQDVGRGGGRLIDLGSHLIDQALQLFRSPVATVFCRTHHDYPGLSIESHAMLTLGFADGRTAIIDTTGMCHTPKPRIQALGTRATFTKYGADPQEAALADGRIDEARERSEEWGTLAWAGGQRIIQTLPGRWRSFYEQLGDALSAWPEAELPVLAEQADRVVHVLEAAFASARDGRTVVLNV